MRKKLLGSSFPNTLLLGKQLGKPLIFLAVEASGVATDDPQRTGIVACSLSVVGPYDFPFAVDAHINPECRIDPSVVTATGISQRRVANEETWPQFWSSGAGNAIAGGLVAGVSSIALTLQLIDRQLRRYDLPVPAWDWLDLSALYRSVTGTAWDGTLLELATELAVPIPADAPRATAEMVVGAHIVETILTRYGADKFEAARHPAVALAPAAEPDPFAAMVLPRARPGLHLVDQAPSKTGDRDPFNVGEQNGDSVPPMTPFYGGALTLQECCDAMLDKLVADGVVRNYAEVIGALRGMGLILEKSKNPYEGVVVETAIRAKRRLRGKYYRPNFSVPSPSEEMVATIAAAAATQKTDMMARLEQQIRGNGYRTLDHQLRLVIHDFPQATRQTIAYAVSMLLDQGRLEHQLAADDAILSWLTDAVQPLLRRGSGAGVLLKPIMSSLLTHPTLTKTQVDQIDYVQLRVALHRLGTVYPQKRRTS